MRAQLEAIAQALAQEMETTGTLALGGRKMYKNSSNPSPYGGLCRPAVEKLVELVKEALPYARVDRVSFTTVNDDAWKRSRHVVAQVTTLEGVYIVDPTIRQYRPDAGMVYSKDVHYPIEFYPGSITLVTVYDGLAGSR